MSYLSIKYIEIIAHDFEVKTNIRKTIVEISKFAPYEIPKFV
jgi:hypothetical protein